MNVISKNDGLLTYVEVLDILKSKKRPKVSGNLSSHDLPLQESDYIHQEVIKYLSQGPTKSSSQNAIKELLNELDSLSLGLTEGELIQIGNLLPMYLVELYIMIDNCAERYDEETVNTILHTIHKYRR